MKKILPLLLLILLAIAIVYHFADQKTEVEKPRQELSLLDCLQFSDKGQIIARNRQLLDITQFTSRRRFEDVIKRLESLRNNLAHAQDILTSDWKTIVELSENLEEILVGTQDQAADDSPSSPD